MRRNASQAFVPTEFPFAQGDDGFNGKALADHADLGLGEMNIFAPGLKAREDADFLKEADAPTSEEAAIAENSFGQPAESGLEPTKGGGDQGGVGDVVGKGVDDVGDAFDKGDQDLRTEFGSEGKLPPHNRTDVIFVKRDNPMGNRGDSLANLALLMKNDPNFLFGLFKGFQEIPQARIVFAGGTELKSGFGS